MRSKLRTSYFTGIDHQPNICRASRHLRVGGLSAAHGSVTPPRLRRGRLRSVSNVPDLISHPKGTPEDEVRNNDSTTPPKIKVKIKVKIKSTVIDCCDQW